MSIAMKEAAAPSWYVDPADLNLERYWDGEAWTQDTRPASYTGTPAPGASGTRAPEVLGIAALLGFILALVLLALLVA